jgi:glycosyltransferase involved in cell wall biosynthesis
VKILWHSNTPTCGTGYGQQTALFAPLLAQDHDLAISANFGASVGMSTWNGIPVFPNGTDNYGNGYLPSHGDVFFDGDRKSGLILTLFDTWTFERVPLDGFNLASWVPVDHDPCPSSVVHFFRRFNGKAIAMSQFGQRALAEYAVEAHYVPHGIDTQVFRPIDRDLAREVLHKASGVPQDAYVVGMVAANKGAQPPRKAFPEVMLAFAEFKRKQKDAVLYLHTERFGHQMGCKLDPMAIACGLEPDKDVFFPPQYDYAVGIPNEIVNAVYNALDVLVNPAYGEGFGVPIVEAQAAGTPVIVNDFTSMSELCGSGWKVDGEKFWDEAQMTFFQKPSVRQLVNAMQLATRAGDKDRQKARAFAAQYDHRLVYEKYMKPALEAIEQDYFEPVKAKPVKLSVV